MTETASVAKYGASQRNWRCDLAAERQLPAHGDSLAFWRQ